MNTETPKIEIYRTRTFSEKLSDTFAFLRENWRPIMKYYVYFMLPLSILLAFPTSHFFSKYFELVIALENDFANFNWVSFAVSAVASVILAMVTAIVLTSLFFSMVRLYSAREMRLQALEFEELKQEMLFCAKRTLILMATGIAIGLIIMIVFIGIIAIIISMSSGFAGAISSVFGMLLLYIGLIVVIPPLQLVTPIYLMEDETGVIDAYRNLTKNGQQFYLKSNFFDLLMGTTRVRQMIAEGKSADEIKATWQGDVELFKAQRKPYLLYEE